MQKTDIRLIAADLDGTLFNDRGEFTEYTRNTLKQLHDEGKIIVIASGRPWSSIRRRIPEDLFDYAISYNGQDIYDVKNDKHIYSPCLTKEEMKELIGYLKNYHVLLSYSEDEIFYQAVDDRRFLFAVFYNFAADVYHFLKRVHSYRRYIVPSSAIKVRDCPKFCFSGTNTELRKLAAKIGTERYSVFFVSNRWMEVMHKGIDKGTALRTVMDLCGVRSEHACAIGDGENDIYMMKEVKYSVAMGNAMENAKKAAAYTAPGNAEDGAAVWLNENV